MQVIPKQQAVARSDIAPFKAGDMIRLHRIIFAIGMVLLLAMVASAQVSLHPSEEILDQIDGATEALGLSDQQVEQIREIQSVRPPQA